MILVLATALLLLACGSHNPGAGSISAGRSPSPTAGSSPSPTPPQVTNADANRTISMQTGQEVHITLKADPGFDAWSVPSSSDPSVLQPVVDTRATAMRGTTVASFRALKTGTARLDAMATPHCDPGQTCPHLAIPWSVTVQVS